VDDWRDEQVIKVTLTGRLRSHPNAPATVNVDALTWSAGEIESLRNAGDSPENYRTDDNAAREYVLSEVNGNYECVFRTGDAGTGSSITGEFDKPFGACYPVFFFGRLIQEPYDDGNDIKELHDSRCLIDSLLHMEIATRAICEGFVDARTSQDIVCRNGEGNLFDYTFENLCHDAFGGRWIGAFDLDVREDSPGGFGPLPSTKMYAEVFNRLVSCVNLLDKVRLDLPINFKYREFDYRDDRPVSLTESGGTSCTTVGTCKAYGDGLVASPATTLVAGSPSAWDTWTTIGAFNKGQLGGCPYVMISQRRDTEYKVEIDPDYWNAVPAEVLDLVNLGGTGFLAIKTTTLENERREAVPDEDGDRCPTDRLDFPPLWKDGDQAYRWRNTATETSECILVNSGVLQAPGTPSSDYKIGRQPPLPETAFCGNLAAGSVRLDLIAEQGAFLKVPLV